MDTSSPSSSAAAQAKFLAVNNVKDLDAAFVYDEVEARYLRLHLFLSLIID